MGVERAPIGEEVEPLPKSRNDFAGVEMKLPHLAVTIGDNGENGAITCYQGYV